MKKNEEEEKERERKWRRDGLCKCVWSLFRQIDCCDERYGNVSSCGRVTQTRLFTNIIKTDTPSYRLQFSQDTDSDNSCGRKK